MIKKYMLKKIKRDATERENVSVILHITNKRTIINIFLKTPTRISKKRRQPNRKMGTSAEQVLHKRRHPNRH